MADFDPKNNGDSFDREFTLNSKKKTAAKGKLPSWLMILVGAAMIAAVVIVKKPAIQPISGTRASINGQSSEQLTVNSSPITGDEKAGPQELEARFGAVGADGLSAAPASLIVSGDDRVYSIQLDELPVDESGEAVPSGSDGTVFWVDEKPFAVSLEPADAAEAADADKQSVSLYQIEDKTYTVKLEPLDSGEMTSLSEDELAKVVHVGDAYYRLDLDPVQPESAEVTAAEPTAEPSSDGGSEVKAEAPENLTPDADPFAAESTETADAPEAAAPEPAIVWLDNQPYTVTVNPYTEPEEVSRSGKSVIPVTVVSDEGEPEPKTVVFESDGKQYEITVKAIDPEKALSAGNAQPVIWMDETPLRVELSADETDAADDSFDISLEQLPEETAAILYETRFGRPYDDGSKAAVPEVTEEPETVEVVVTETAEVQNENFFVSLFHNIFGGAPTAVPTPQVTVIAVTPTEQPVRPTATPIVVRMAPTAEPQSPVRLGDAEDAGGTQKIVEEKSGNIDPALVDDGRGAPTAAPMITIIPTSTKSGAVSVPVSMVTETPVPGRSAAQPTAVPTQEELPQTGLAESWNIPSMFAMLFGLLLVIIGVRRLRANH